MVEGYRPSTDDILRTRIITKGISEINFKIKVTYILSISTHCLKIQKTFNWKILFFFFPPIIIGHGYKYDWCGWATLRTKEMAKMFWFSSSSDLCSFLSRIWSGILILYYHACRQLFWIPEKVQFEEVARLFEKNLPNQMSMHSNGQKCHGILIVKMI